MTDPLKGAKVSKPNKSEKVPTSGEASLEELAAGTDGAADAPAQEDAPEGELSDKERAEAAAELAKTNKPPAPSPIPPTYLVRKGGRAWYRGQQIKFQDGETFTSETWDENAVAGFRECGVTIERTA